MTNPHRLPTVRWVQVQPDGREINLFSKPKFGFALCVEIIARSGNCIMERTWCAAGGRPKGRGWRREHDPEFDHPEGDYFSYVRTRRVPR